MSALDLRIYDLILAYELAAIRQLPDILWPGSS